MLAKAIISRLRDGSSMAAYKKLFNQHWGHPLKYLVLSKQSFYQVG